jgi:hypothetical protein
MNPHESTRVSPQASKSPLVISILKWLWDAFQLIRNSTWNPQSTNFAAAK